ncbi:MAG: peptide MFS transporter [Muribaculaceae bacterium]|nr:peptide MFS transporter [Muribaculaceae bacterium]
MQKHPKGLYLLFFVEMWERFSYYGMRALVVLYMVQSLMFSTQKAGNIYGLYTGLVYLTPLIGGYLADRYFGQRRCITTGAILMSIGLFLLAFAPKSLFLLSLFLMISANGFFKSNISSVLGLLYGDNNDRKDAAYTIFYMGINLGAFLSPLVCGTLAVKYGFEYGFVTAGCGMLIGLFVYKLFENKLLGNCGLEPVLRNTNTDSAKTDLDIEQKNRFAALIVLMLFTIPFWICFEQAGSSLTLFAQYQTNRNVLGFEIPTGYFQSLNPLFIITLAPLMSLLWGRLRDKSREPGSVEKFVISLFLISISYIVLAIAGYLAESSLVSPLWLVAAYFIMTVSELCLSPIGLSLVSKLAPKQFLSLAMGCWFLTSFAGNLIAGFLGGKYDIVTPCQLFTFLAVFAMVVCVLLRICLPALKKRIGGDV